jgi:SM-20-related protein
MSMVFSLDPALSAPQLAAVYERYGRLHIPGILEPACAAALGRHLASELSWTRVFNSGADTFELDAVQMAAMTPERWARLEASIHASAREGFQFCFDSVRVSDDADERNARGWLIDAFAAFLNGPEFLGFARAVTGAADIDFVDAQGTAYSAGHFLTSHDDAVAGKGRRAAYVFNFTPQWRADWGGLLQFQDADGHISEAFTPRFNALNIFRVPQPHSVSSVAPFAGATRYSVTGWLRHLG